jgi:hypothetical protein
MTARFGGPFFYQTCFGASVSLIAPFGRCDWIFLGQLADVPTPGAIPLDAER